MARARNIKPGFFRNADLAELSFECRLLFIGLWTLADREGRLEDRPKQIKMEIFPADNLDCNAALDELASTGMLVRYEHDGKRFLQVTNFAKHQNPHRDERPSTIPAQCSAFLGETETPCNEDAETADAQCEHGADTVPIRLNPESRILIPDSGYLIPDSPTEYQPANAGSSSSLDAPQDPEPVDQAENQKNKIPPCPHLDVLQLWAEVLPAMPQHNPDMWRGARADHLRARWRETATAKKWPDQETGLAYFRKLFAFVGKSPFLTGQSRSTDPSKRPFVIELEWLVNPSNWAKTHEGKYHTEA